MVALQTLGIDLFKCCSAQTDEEKLRDLQTESDRSQMYNILGAAEMKQQQSEIKQANSRPPIRAWVKLITF